MEKTINITLNGLVFNIEEDAYEELDEYLNSIKNHFASADDKDENEIINDIEASIAEKFGEKIKENKQVITAKDVKSLIKTMGTVEDFKDFDNNKKDRGDYKKSQLGFKKLYRNSDDKVVAGVCSGLAAYFGIDPVIVRILFVISIFFGGTGFLAYLILWVAMPEAKTSAQKLAMHGDPVTLKRIESKVKSQKSKVKNKTRNLLYLPFKFLADIFSVLARFLKKIWPIITALIASALIFGALVSVGAIIFAGAILIFNINSPYVNSEIPLSEITSSASYYVGIISASFVAIVPLLVILFLGIAILKRKNIFNAILNSVLISLWMLAIITLGVAAIDMAPIVQEKVKEIDSDQISLDLDLKDFDRIRVDKNYKINISQGKEFSIQAQGRERDLDLLLTKMENKELIVSRQENDPGICLFCYHRPVILDISMPGLKELQIARGLANVDGFQGENIKIKVEKGAELNLNNIEVDFGEIILSNWAEAKCQGKIKDLKINLGHRTKLDAFDLVAENVLIEADNFSQAKINASEKINAILDDQSTIYYIGEAEVVRQIPEMSKVKKLESREAAREINGGNFTSEGVSENFIYLESDNRIIKVVPEDIDVSGQGIKMDALREVQ